jgi:hypothetical protein
MARAGSVEADTLTRAIIRATREFAVRSNLVVATFADGAVESDFF